MEWNHLYRSGAVEDQSPMLLKCFDVIHRAKALYEKERNDKREKEAQARKNKPPSRPSGGRRRR